MTEGQLFAPFSAARPTPPLDNPRMAGVVNSVARHLKANGPSDHAFGREHIPPAQQWKTARRGAPSEHAA
jgi:hypothetical protein